MKILVCLIIFGSLQGMVKTSLAEGVTSGYTNQSKKSQEECNNNIAGCYKNSEDFIESKPNNNNDIDFNNNGDTLSDEDLYRINLCYSEKPPSWCK